jgi:hypothetical protein
MASWNHYSNRFPEGAAVRQCGCMIRAFFFNGPHFARGGKDSGKLRFPDGWIALPAPSLASSSGPSRS